MKKKQKKNPYKVFGISTDSGRAGGEGTVGAIGWYRIINPLEKLGANISLAFKFAKTYENALQMKSQGDIWVTKMADNEDIDIVYSAHREATKSKLVLDLDDDPFLINDAHPDKDLIQAKKFMRERLVRMADHIIVSTEPIKQSVKSFNPYVTVIPNAIDPKIWEVKKKKKNDGIIRIGWIASGSHVAEFPIILEVFSELRDKYKNVEFHFAGITMEDFEENRVFHHRGTASYLDFPQWYANLGIDISVAPLLDTPFNRAKSNIKWMEASMLEIPTVASDVLPYQCIKQGRTGYLAKTKGQFIKHLSWLIENKELREKIGKQAKQEILDNWTTDKFLHLYKNLFNSMNDKKDLTVITSITGGKDTLKDQPTYPGVQYLAFTDQKSDFWTTKKPCDKFKDPVMNAKIHKVLAHMYCDTEYIVWMDGNMTLKQDPHELIKLLDLEDCAFFTHPGRDCIYEEAEACLYLKKGKYEEITEQVKDYSNPDKYAQPQHGGMAELTCFVRKNTPEVNTIFEKWWAQICRYSERDQISFPVVFGHYDTIPGSIGEIAGDVRFPGNKYFKFSNHKK